MQKSYTLKPFEVSQKNDMQYGVGNEIRLVNQNPVALFIETKPSTISDD